MNDQNFDNKYPPKACLPSINAKVLWMFMQIQSFPDTIRFDQNKPAENRFRAPVFLYTSIAAYQQIARGVGAKVASIKNQSGHLLPAN